MVIRDQTCHGSHDPEAAAPYRFGDCHSLLANCCSQPRVSSASSLKFRPLNRKRRQMAFQMLRQMKQQQSELLSTRSKRRRDKNRFYKGLCCTGKISKCSIAMSSDWALLRMDQCEFHFSFTLLFFFLDLHITESQSSVYSPSMAAATAASKYKSRIPSAGLANELYFASHKLDEDSEKTPPALLREKRRAPQSTLASTETTPATRRPIPSPVRSTTYVLQQHHRVNNNVNNHQINAINRKLSSPVRANQSPASPTTPVTLNRNRQTQQQRTYSNHERLPTPASATVDSSTNTAAATTTITHQQFVPRVQTPLASRRPAPIVKTTPAKAQTSNIPRPPRVRARNQQILDQSYFLSLRIQIPATPPVRLSRPSPTIPSRSPRTPIRPANTIVSSTPSTPKSTGPRYTLSKSPEPLRPATGTVNRPRPAHTVVNKSRMGTANTTASPMKTPTSVIVQQPTTARVSDLDALMAKKQPTIQSPRTLELKTPAKPSIISPSPVTDTIRRSLFSTNAVKHVRPVRSQELKIFSCHLTPDNHVHSIISDDVSSASNSDETHSTLTDCRIDRVTRQTPIADTNASPVVRELSEDSLNEHHHIKQLLESSKYFSEKEHRKASYPASRKRAQFVSVIFHVGDQM